MSTSSPRRASSVPAELARVVWKATPSSRPMTRCRRAATPGTPTPRPAGGGRPPAGRRRAGSRDPGGPGRATPAAVSERRAPDPADRAGRPGPAHRPRRDQTPAALRTDIRSAGGTTGVWRTTQTQLPEVQHPGPQIEQYAPPGETQREGPGDLGRRRVALRQQQQRQRVQQTEGGGLAEVVHLERAVAVPTHDRQAPGQHDVAADDQRRHPPRQETADRRTRTGWPGCTAGRPAGRARRRAG